MLEIDKFFRKECCLHNKLHRDDGPAVIILNKYQAWSQNGLLHRDGGPAVIFTDGRQEWWRNGLRHRTDGPAVIWPHGSEEWWQNGIRLVENNKNKYKDSHCHNNNCGQSSWFIYLLLLFLCSPIVFLGVKSWFIYLLLLFLYSPIIVFIAIRRGLFPSFWPLYLLLLFLCSLMPFLAAKDCQKRVQHQRTNPVVERTIPAVTPNTQQVPAPVQQPQPRTTITNHNVENQNIIITIDSQALMELGISEDEIRSLLRR